MIDYHVTALAEARARLAEHPLRAATLAQLRQRAPAVETELHDTILAEIPAFTESHNPATLPELAAHVPLHLAEIERLLMGGAIGELDFVRAFARSRAEHRFPLEAVLHVYRCAHKVFARGLRDAVRHAATSLDATGSAADLVAAMADFTLEYTDAVSTVASTAYVEQVRLMADVAGDQRAQLLNILLDGYDESDARVAVILRQAGLLDGRQTFCVVLAQSVDATEMGNPARARRLADTLDQLVPTSVARRLIDIRDGRVTAVFSALRRLSGWTVPSRSLAARISDSLATAGNSVLIGVGGEVSSTSSIPGAHRQALLALRLAGPAQRVMSFADIALRQLMIHLAGEELQRLLPAWAGEFQRADDRLAGALSTTLRAYADADMNLHKAAARLGLHPNTVYARLNRIRDITGLNARAYHPLTDLLTVADARVATPGLTPGPRRAATGAP